MFRRISLPALCAYLAAAMPAFALAQDLPAAAAAFERGDYIGVIETLLPAELNGRLDDAGALKLLALACEQATVPPRNRRHECHKRRAEIMVKAAERGDPQAMYAASIGLLDSGLGRVGIRMPLLNDGKRVDALMWAALAAHFARFIPDDDLQRRASARATDLARGLHQEWRGQETLAQRAMRLADAKKDALQDTVSAQVARQAHARGVAALGGSGKLPWLDADAQSREHRYLSGPDWITIDELDFMEEGSESDAGAPPHLDPGSIVRNGDQIQYQFSTMDDSTLVQAACNGGAPTLIWEGDADLENPEMSLWIFRPAWRQPIPRDQGEIDWYRPITLRACSLAPQ